MEWSLSNIGVSLHLMSSYVQQAEVSDSEDAEQVNGPVIKGTKRYG